ncbi:MAG: NUMOD3 domain-containing DNA-binding protein, partial [Halobacteriales archaeon]
MDRPYRDRDWIEEKYHGEGLTQREIAEECGVSPTAIGKRMKRNGIETREVKGENHGLYGEERKDAVKKKISEKLKGRTFSEETRQRISDALSGKSTPPEVREKISRSLTGLKRPMETREKMSRSTAGENNPNWQGGYEYRYGEGWAPARDRVLDRDEVCQNCGEDGTNHVLHVHHIVPVRFYREAEGLTLGDAHRLENLILLCNRCHGKAE